AGSGGPPRIDLAARGGHRAPALPRPGLGEALTLHARLSTPGRAYLAINGVPDDVETAPLCDSPVSQTESLHHRSRSGVGRHRDRDQLRVVEQEPAPALHGRPAAFGRQAL